MKKHNTYLEHMVLLYFLQFAQVPLCVSSRNLCSTDLCSRVVEKNFLKTNHFPLYNKNDSCYHKCVIKNCYRNGGTHGTNT